MNHSPLVSIIVPCYNSAPYLPACIDSLKNQSVGMDCLQFIFVDDASSDDTLAILSDFESHYPEFLKDYYLAIEAMFLRTYYMDTLLFVLERFDAAPVARLREMQDTIRTCFPSWQDNPFLIHQQTELEQRLLSTLKEPFTAETFQALKDSI